MPTVILAIALVLAGGCDEGFGLKVINESHRAIAVALDGGHVGYFEPGARSGYGGTLWRHPGKPEARIVVRDKDTGQVLFSRKIVPSDLNAEGNFVLVLVDSDSGVTEKEQEP